MTNSRQKGAAGEREVAQELHRQLGMNFKRNLNQYQERSEGDLVCDNEAFPFCIEVKRAAKGWTCRPAWEVQAFEQAEKVGKFPCVIYRFDGQQWRCRVWFDALAEAFGAFSVCNRCADMDMQSFAWVVREIMARKA
jgi:Holliday junction resolvase